ncbi:hypothetical protein CRUP_037302 [Coryphaenoides rupestris]|nr:hypothetical protein CRUP_037302 [Coryphaenoides rupestris]
MAVPGKQYGLVLPQKKALTKTTTLQRPSVFGDDSDDETSVGESLQKEAVKKRMMKQTRLEMQKALAEDSTVYDYDGIYDDIQSQRLESSKKIMGERKPKYINQLMKAVEERKKEQDRRDERKIQKEREAEGEEFADKDAYVTAAYRQKLKERQEELEKEKREAALEGVFSAFHRKQSSAPPAAPDTTSAAPSPPPGATGTTGASVHSDSEDGHESKPGFSKPGLGSGLSKRHYRRRSLSPGSGDERARHKVQERERHKKSQRDGERERDRDRERDRERDRRSERDGERDDRHRGRRDDKERRRDRGGEREREGGQHRGREERERREQEREKREQSPKERRRDDGGDEEEEKRKGKRGIPQEEKERMKDPEKDRAVKPEATATEGGQLDTQKESAEKPNEGSDGAAAGGASEGEQRASKFAKRCNEQTVGSARERYLARQMARSASKTYIEKEED